VKRRTPQLRSSPRKRGPTTTESGSWIPGISAFTRVHSPSKTGVNALEDALCAGMNGIARRDFMLALAGAAAAWPLAARAQQARKIFRIGYLGVSSSSLEPHYVEAFRQRLRDLGHIEGESIAIEYRWADGEDDRLPNLAAELVRLNPDIIVTTGTPSTLAAMQATKTIPIIMASSADPVAAGLVANLARPKENVTGFTILGPELEAKRLELLKQTVPSAARVAILRNPSNPAVVSYFEAIKTASQSLRIAVDPVAEVRRADEFDDAFSAIVSARPDALAVLADRFLLAHRKRIVEFAAANRLPSMYPYREYVDAGGLISYAPSNVELFRGAAIYVDKILKGAKPTDLPVQEPTKFELVVNLKTAKALGLTIPPTLLFTADEVIE
jgi:putative tryptophan/tyrosine transport system substrate-binding protein